MDAAMPNEQDKPITRADLAAFEVRIAAQIERVETTLLTEFHKSASPAEMKLRSHATALRALDLQADETTDTLRRAEQRIAALERKAEGRQG